MSSSMIVIEHRSSAVSILNLDHRELHDDERQNFCSSPHVVRVTLASFFFLLKSPTSGLGLLYISPLHVPTDFSSFPFSYAWHSTHHIQYILYLFAHWRNLVGGGANSTPNIFFQPKKFVIAIIINNICLLQLGWRSVAVVVYVYTDMNWDTNLIKTGGAAWEACSSNLESWEPSQHKLIDRHRETKKICAEMAGSRTFRILDFSQQSGN